MEAENPHLEVRTPADRETAARIATVPVGAWLTVIVTAGAQIYAVHTWDQPNRDLITALSIVAIASAIGISLLPIERIVRGAWREIFFFGWTAGMLVMIGVLTAADGGANSPFAVLFALPILFASLSYPLRITMVLGVLAVTVFVAAELVAGDASTEYTVFWSFALICVALLCAWESRGQIRAWRAHGEAAMALRRSEKLTRAHAEQQKAVADLGQLALEGADVDELCAEAVKLVRTRLDVDFSAVLKYLPDEDAFVIKAEDGMRPGEVGARIPAGMGSQAGYTLATGEAVVVADWRREDRFEQSRILHETGAISGATTLVRAKGESFGVLGAQSTTQRDFSAEEVSFIQSIANVLANAIERHAAEQQTRHEALHDPLTGLPNRTLFMDRLGHALVQAGRRDSSVAVLFCDLDQFKLVNDSLGHAAGDELLAAVALRFEQTLRPEDTIARFGGDEFAVLVEDVSAERDATRVAERLAASLARPFILRRREHFVSASIGISIAVGEEKPEAMIRDADAALYRAKDRGRGRYEIFDEVMRARVVAHMQIENDLRRALERGELELHYQPVISLRDGRITGLEALMRWRHPDRGLLAPPDFIPAAEASQLILPMGRWAITEALRAAGEWQRLDPDGPPLRIAVNLSARLLTDPRLPADLGRAIEANGIEPVTVELEITETALLEEAESPERCIRRLKALGVRMVLDDFGTGFSSLGYLRRFPLDAIKLDRTFVEHLADRSEDEAIVRAVVEMAGALGLEVIAEGVETSDQLAAVSELGCGHAQGFYFAKPTPVEEVAEMLGERPWALVTGNPGG
jgi:diguanylate cyclase (GGDEF)-like protein